MKITPHPKAFKWNVPEPRVEVDQVITVIGVHGPSPVVLEKPPKPPRSNGADRNHTLMVAADVMDDISIIGGSDALHDGDYEDLRQKMIALGKLTPDEEKYLRNSAKVSLSYDRRKCLVIQEVPIKQLMERSNEHSNRQGQGCT